MDPADAAGWLGQLLERGLEIEKGTAFAAVQLARLTGDRTRDLEDEIRIRTVRVLKKLDAPERWRRLLTEVAAFETVDEDRALGDTLPIGLRLG